MEIEWGKLKKIPARQLTKVKKKKEVIEEARNKGRQFHFALLMDSCHLENSELEPQYQKYKGKVVLRGDIVKDDSGSYAVFTEQGSSASQMTAAKVMDIISRPADAVCAYTQVKMEDASTLLKLPKSECPDIWVRLPKHKWPESMSSMEDPVVPLERNLGMLICQPSRRTIPISVVDDIELAGKTENMEPTWKVLMEDVDLGEPTSFLDCVYWVALKESVKLVRILWQTTEICSNPGFLLEPRKNYRPGLQGNLMQKQYHLGPMTWKVTQRNV